MYLKEDATPGAGPDRLRVTEPTYQAVPGTIKTMKRNEQNHVDNQQSVNYMAVVHDENPETVTQIPEGMSVQAGHGKFLPGSKGYKIMMGAPNVKLIANSKSTYGTHFEH